MLSAHSARVQTALCRAAWRVVCAASATVLMAPPAAAQASANTTMTMVINSPGAGSTINFPAATSTDFANGFVLATTTVTLTTGITTGGADRTTQVFINSPAANLGNYSTGGTKPITDLEWQRSSSAGTTAWTPISGTSVDQLLESRFIVKNGANDPWSCTVSFRMKLSYANDVPGTYRPPAGSLVTFKLTVSP